jgi:chromate transporter
VLLGVKPVVLAVVLQALLGFGRTALRSSRAWLVALAALAAAAAGVHELVVLLGAGVAAVLLHVGRRKGAAAVGLLGLAGPGTAIAAATGAAAATPAAVFLVFARIGSVLFGSGYVLLAFLRADLVQRLGWLSEPQLLDAIAVGQVTPGPVFTTATFVGYLVAGGAGAVAATLGIFLPAFFFVAISGPLIPRLRRSPIAGALLDGVNWASLALMALVTFELGAGALREPLGVLLFAAAAVLLLRFKVSSSWLVLAGAAVGVLRGLAAA